MTQYHYVVGYDDEEDRWFLELDREAYFPDGNMFDAAKAESPEWGYSGWFQAEEDHPETAIDEKAFRTLQYIIDTIPKPKE
jgi:hypothetical protein